MDINQIKVNFLGDSITAGAGALYHENCYVNYISREYGAICRNYGIGGTRIARQQKPYHPKWDQDFCSRWDIMDEDADVVAVFGGTNDFGHGDADLGNPNDQTPETFYGALNYLYSNLLKRYPDSLIIVITPLHRVDEDNLRGEGNKEKDMYPLEVYVKAIRETANNYALPILDLFEYSKLWLNNDKDYFVDGLHPTDMGHEIIAKQIIEFIKER